MRACVKISLCFAVFLMVGMSAAPAKAAFFSGRYLLHVCAMDENGKEITQGGHTACQAYIAGMIDYHNVLRSLGTAPSVDFCIPEKEKLVDIQKNVYRYFYYNQELHNEFIASPGLGLALARYYPCKK